MTVPAASIIIPTIGRPQLLRATLDHLTTQTAASFEVIVSVNGHDAGTDAVVTSYSNTLDIRTIHSVPPGPGPTRNAGARIARSDILIFLDDDILAVPDLVEAHLRHHVAADNIVVTGPVPIERGGREPAHYRSVRYWWNARIARLSRPGHQPAILDISAANMSVGRRRFIEIGGFTNLFAGRGREDCEIAFRLRRSGARFVFEPAAIGTHRYRKSITDFIRGFSDIGRADVRLLRLHPAAFQEIPGLGVQPYLPDNPVLRKMGEWISIALNSIDGDLWHGAAWRTQIAHYWQGVRMEARDEKELGYFLDEWAATRPEQLVNPFPVPPPESERG